MCDIFPTNNKKKFQLKNKAFFTQRSLFCLSVFISPLLLRQKTVPDGAIRTEININKKMKHKKKMKNKPQSPIIMKNGLNEDIKLKTNIARTTYG